MNVLIVAPDMKIPGTYGGSNHVMSISQALKSMGYGVEIVARADSEPEFKGIKIHRIKKTNPISFFNDTKNKVSELVKSKKFGLIYERSRIFGGAGCYIAKKNNIPSILEVNDPMVDTPLIEKRINPIIGILARIWEKKMFRWATRIVTQHAIMAKGVEKSKVRVITNAADASALKPASKSKELVQKYSLENKFVFAYVGSFGEWHGTEMIIEAFNNGLKKYKSLRLLMIGEGPYKKVCRELCKKYGIEEYVIFTGDVKKDEIDKYLSIADVGISLFNKDYLPFKRLGYYFSPIKIFEYLAIGKPVILSKAENTEKLFTDGEAGYFVNPNNIKDLTNVMLKISKDRITYRKMCKNARDLIVKKYNWKNIVQKSISGLI